jgi:2,4-dienoyl-CoA reductase (NADPH2)
MHDPLFQPIILGTVEVKNRIFMPAMHMNMCRNFQVTERLIDFYRERAEGGAGCISVGYATVDRLSGSPGNIGAHDDCFLPGLTSLAQAIQAGGARAAVQLNHAGRYNASFFLGGEKPVAPSAIASRLTREIPRALTLAEIEQTIAAFAAAAGRVQQAGYDLVEILAGTGYLISEFLSPLTNQRTDQYGGSLENRMRFGLEVIRAVKSRVGRDYPLLVRINGNDYMEGGIGAVILQQFAVRLVEAGADALCINVGWHEAQVPQIVTKVPRGVFAYMARDIKELVTVPVIASHRINDPQTARRLLAAGFCDMVAIGRALIADPQFPKKIEQGRENEIIHCVACGQGCFDNLFKMKAVECLCNPRAGHEQETRSERTVAPQKVMVVGGGAAGMWAALAAVERGHQVSLYERTTSLGGQLHLAGAPPGRDEFRILAADLGLQLWQSGAKVVLNTAVDVSLLVTERPDMLIIATGGKPIYPDLPGVDQEHVVQAWEILAGTRQAGRRVAIIGGGAVGVETALLLAEQGTLSGEELKFLLVNGAEQPEQLYRLATRSSRTIYLIEMIDKLGNNFGKSTRWGMLQDVDRYGVSPCLQAKVLEITPTGVKIEAGDEVREIAADTVILAVGTKSENSLRRIAAELGIPCQVVGDAQQPGTVFEATHQGYAAGRSVV